MKAKHRCVFALTFAVACIGTVSPECRVYAKEKSDYQTTITYESDNDKEQREGLFEAQIEIDGKKYKLEGITYEAVEKEKPQKTVESKPIAYGEESEYTPSTLLVEDGVVYKLDQSIPEEVTIEERYVQNVTAYNEYSYKVTQSDVPATKKVSVTNQKTKKTEEVICSISEIKTVDAGWTSTYIDILFEAYDAHVYRWNGITVSNATEKPLAGYETELLASVGANTTDYKVLDTYWLGEVYTNSNGILCRKARADVQRHSINYRANYVGKIESKEVLGSKYIDTYSYVKGEGDRYVITATANYVRDNLIQYLTIGAAIFILTFVIILFLISNRKKKTEEKEENV